MAIGGVKGSDMAPVRGTTMPLSGQRKVILHEMLKENMVKQLGKLKFIPDNMIDEALKSIPSTLWQNKLTELDKLYNASETRFKQNKPFHEKLDKITNELVNGLRHGKGKFKLIKPAATVVTQFRKPEAGLFESISRQAIKWSRPLAEGTYKALQAAQRTPNAKVKTVSTAALVVMAGVLSAEAGKAAGNADAAEGIKK